MRVATQSGRVTVVAEERADFVFETRKPWIEDVIVGEEGEVAPVLDRGSRDIRVLCPLGTDVVIGTQSGLAELQGELGRVKVRTQSGHIELERAEMADLRSESGDITVDACGDRCRVSTKSGKATVGSSGATEVMTVSGSILLEGAAGQVRAKSASGTVAIRTSGKHDVAVETFSGSVRVCVPENVHPEAMLKTASGSMSVDCEQGSDCRVAVRTMSGKVEVVPG